MKRLLLLLLASPLTVSAQRLACTGRIEGPSHEAVTFATVTLLRDGTQAAGTATDAEGCFALEVPEGTYTLDIRHLCYRAVEHTVTLDAPTNLGILVLEPLGTQIDAVAVTALAVERRADRFVVEVHDTPALAGRDATELLEQAPGVWLDDEGLTINGAGGTKIFIDERELQLSPSDQADYLRTLTAGDIARIEVIPQTGAEYAADTRGGVVRITLRRRLRNGANGSVQFSTTQSAALSSYAPAANVSLRAGKWTINASGAGTFTPQAEGRYDESRIYRQPGPQFAASSTMDLHTNYGRGRLGVIRDIGERHTLALEGEYTVDDHRNPTRSQSDLTVDGIRRLTDSRYRQSGNERTFSGTFNYILHLDTLGSAFKLLADYTHNVVRADNSYRSTVTVPESSHDTLYRSDAASRRDILTVDAGLEKHLPHGILLRTGAKYTHNATSDRTGYAGFGRQEWIARPEYGYALDYTEQIGALYASFTVDAGRWNAGAGVRGEYTRTTGKGIGRSYFDLFPGASASYAFNALKTWMLVAQYSRNIERPAFSYLNPGRIQISDYSYQVGNPSLRPTYLHRLSLTAVWKYRYTLSVGGNRHRNLVREICRTDTDDPQISWIIPENHYAEDHWFAAASAPLQPTRWWKLTLGFVGVMQRIELVRHAGVATHYLMFANAVSGFTLPAGFYLECSYNGQSRLYSGTSEVAPRHIFSLAAKKRFCRDRLTLTLAVRNLTDRGVGYASETGTFRHRTTGRQAGQGRCYKVGLAWNFRTGREFRARQIESASQAERRRLSKTEAQSK